MSIFGELMKPLEAWKQDGKNEFGTIGIHNTQIVEGAPEMVFPDKLYLTYDLEEETYLGSGGYVDKAKISHTFEGMGFGDFEVRIKNMSEISIFNAGFEYEYILEGNKLVEGQTEFWYRLV